MIEMREGRDYEKKNIKEKMLKELFEKKIRFLLKLRNSDKVKIELKGGNAR
jgi:sulfatase maturation enzyme AslB (radical SAM superfamily)